MSKLQQAVRAAIASGMTLDQVNTEVVQMLNDYSKYDPAMVAEIAAEDLEFYQA